MRRRSSSWLAAVVLTIACSPYVNRGSSLYWEGRYIEAAEVFERTQGRLGQSPSRLRGEYGLYRGLTFLELGDVTRARQWLSYADSVERQSPGTFTTDERALLEDAWGKVGRDTGEEPMQPPPRTVAATSSLRPGDGSTLVRSEANGQRFVVRPETSSLPRSE